ncbi:hypothetical protein SDRG_03632 [Saprolegnia diclina VS20]|uniref:Uncharacterized protein n=1 Tax=Saprolegnia diclina (strain VS20) TaxID=1156394 RepID=T0QMX5_SAPDV|nr:hypothetical protein SDRG_03632 [Saprolegnia diclina VS20]EQC39429.1 hypothetical protein SDRG_03632 [Saprolegnia diclina VS20]|eukprot:XP_008607490.1 hypothetical protein SDRG_03632 [Saprolegnia diclina VS20]
MKPAEAHRSRAPPRSRFQLPTRHLDIEGDIYKALAAVALAAELRLPDAIFPNSTLICTDSADLVYLFCPEHETYHHFLVDCSFIKDVGSLPTALSGYLYSTPTTASNMQRAVFRYRWPVLRACVWFNVWRVRNDRVFRADLPLPS